ncbi:hypothetical protein GCM10022384_67570 [Streptomyces marokkonensis]|uniref:Uncharacterized protein n=1 Tax=Streptomyces marokkonensis TaxID=324855 RepID=A0ABP7SMN2_9ACTN
MSPLPTSSTTRLPYTRPVARPSTSAQATASPAAARPINAPSGSRAISSRSAFLTISTLYAVRMPSSLPRTR